MRVYHDFFLVPDPDQRFLIRIRANDTDPTGSGSETLLLGVNGVVHERPKCFYYFALSRI